LGRGADGVQRQRERDVAGQRKWRIGQCHRDVDDFDDRLHRLRPDGGADDHHR
jgi:hypothetical protein